MGMESDKIKAIVAQAKALTKGEQEPLVVISAMVKDMGRSPTFAVAIYQHLKDAGFDLMKVDGVEAEAFKAKFSSQIEKLGEPELTQIKKISTKLFAA